MTKYTAESSIIINASRSKVWNTITNPDSIRQFLFGTNVKTDWQEGSDIIYEGEYQGKSYRDKGKILKVENESLLQHTYWSSMGGKEDKAENYAIVNYILTEKDDATELTIRQENVQSQQEMEHSQQNWQIVLQKIKELAEA